MKTYNIILTITFILAFYLWVYDGFLYDRTYVRYLPNYQEEVNFPTYSVNANENIETNDRFKNIPVVGKVMFNLFPITLLLTYAMLDISFIIGCVYLFKKGKQLPFKWYITQLILYTGILFFVLDTQIMD